MKKVLTALVAMAALQTFDSPALAQSEGYVYIPGEPGPPLLEVTEDGTLIYGGDVAIACEDMGSGIVTPGDDSSAATRAALERTNERAIEMCTEAGFPPSGSDAARLPETGGVSLAGLIAASVLTGYIMVRRALW